MEKNVPNKSINNTATTAAATPTRVVTSMSYTDLEENIIKWTQELDEQELIFNEQVIQLNARDQQLFANREKIEQLNDAIEGANNEQQNLEYELNFMVAEQKELEELLAPMEMLLEEPGDKTWGCERENMYYIAENIESQIRQMSEDLKEAWA
ncbi:nuclear pore glycoprotein p62-like [Epargyreus clarus]|uniref:nuclear pore glycoprotein p62-like n=1 Tax=Epargyreus clarus TaxID=520877 RepID=UPI003C2B9341